MSKRPRKHVLKQSSHQRKKRQRTEGTEPPEVELSGYESEESPYTSRSSSTPDDVFEDSGSQTSEALPHHPEKPQEERKPGDVINPSVEASAEGGSRPLYPSEMKPGPDLPETMKSKPASPQPSTSRAYHDEHTEETYEAVVRQTETLPGPSKKTKVYSITRSFPETLSLNEYNLHYLNLKDSEQIVIGVPRGIAFQYYDCKEFFLSISQIDVYIIEKKGLDEQEIATPHHTHFYLPGEIYMCKKTNSEAKFSRSDIQSQTIQNITHVHIKSIEDVMAPLHPGYTRSPQYLVVNAPAVAEMQPNFPGQPSDLLYPSDFVEMLISAYANVTPELAQTFSYFRLIPGNFDVLLGIPKNSLNEEYDCYPKITVLSGVDMYFVGKERVDQNSEMVVRMESDIHTHIQFPHGIRACMFRNTPTRYLQNSPCPHDAEVRSSVHIPTSAKPASKTSTKTASLVSAAPESGSRDSASEEELRALRPGSESESSSSSSSTAKPNCYLKLKSPLVEGAIFIDLPRGASCHHNPETNELEGLTGVNVYFIKDSSLEVCPRPLPATSPDHIHLDFNNDAYLCRFEGNTKTHNIKENCTQLSAPATTIRAPSLNVVPIESLESEILKTNLFAIGRKAKSSRPTLVPIKCDVTSSLFTSIKTPKPTPQDPKKGTLRSEPNPQPESLPVVTTTPSKPLDPLQKMGGLIYSMRLLLQPGHPVDDELRTHLDTLNRLLPQSSVSPTAAVMPSAPPYELVFSPEMPEMQHQLPPPVDPPQMQPGPGLFQTQSSPYQMQMGPFPESHQIQSSQEPVQSAIDPFETDTVMDPGPSRDLHEIESMEVDSQSSSSSGI